jgi:tetratricopeptide (TPR) repeat protein
MRLLCLFLLPLIGFAQESVAEIEKAARAQVALGQWDASEQLYERALAMRLDADADPMRSIPTRRQLVQVLIAEKKFGPATQQAFIAISLRSRALGENHPDLAGDNAVLARVYQAQKLWDQAVRTWKEALRIQETAYGLEDLRLADTLDNLASCQEQMREIGAAEAELRRALAIREIHQGPQDPDVAHTLDALGQLLYSDSRYEGAEPLFKRSLGIYTAFLGPGNAQLARSFDNVAVTQAMLQKFAESAANYGEALKIRDTDSALNMHHLALVRAANGDAEVAEALYRRLLAVLDVKGNDNPELRKAATTELEALRKEISSKQAPRVPRAPVAAKQK